MMLLEVDWMENLVLSDDVVGLECDVVLEECWFCVDSELGFQLCEVMNVVLFVNYLYGFFIIGW